MVPLQLTFSTPNQLANLCFEFEPRKNRLKDDQKHLRVHCKLGRVAHHRAFRTGMWSLRFALALGAEIKKKSCARARDAREAERSEVAQLFFSTKKGVE